MNDSGNITLAAVGDICLARGVRKSIEELGTGFVFENVVEELETADLRMGNLEVVFPGSPAAVEQAESEIWAPEGAFRCLTEAGFDILTIGNNHIKDFGAEGLENTIRLLDEAGIVHAGAGMDAKRAGEPAVVDLGSMRVGILSYADDEGQTAGAGRPGTAEALGKRIIRGVSRLKEKADVVLLSLHMDLEFADHPDPYRVRLARKAVSAGADVVLCHHPHVLQGTEVYKGSLICYSLGNFVFQVYGSDYQAEYLPNTAWSVIARIELSKDGYVSHTLVPAAIGEDHRPSIAHGEDAAEILGHIDRISEPIRDSRRLERLYMLSCRRYARTTYWWLRVMLKEKDLGGILQRLWVMAARRPQRRWIAGYARYLLAGISGRRSKESVGEI